MKPLLLTILICLIPLTAFAQETEVRKFPIKSAEPATLQSVIEGIKSEKGKVVYDPNTHSLIVIDTPKNLEKITKVIEEVDVILASSSLSIDVLSFKAVLSMISFFQLKHLAFSGKMLE